MPVQLAQCSRHLIDAQSLLPADSCVSQLCPDCGRAPLPIKKGLESATDFPRELRKRRLFRKRAHLEALVRNASQYLSCRFSRSFAWRKRMPSQHPGRQRIANHPWDLRSTRPHVSEYRPLISSPPGLTPKSPSLDRLPCLRLTSSSRTPSPSRAPSPMDRPARDFSGSRALASLPNRRQRPLWSHIALADLLEGQNPRPPLRHLIRTCLGH